MNLLKPSFVKTGWIVFLHSALIFIFTPSAFSQCMMYPVSLEERVAHSDMIVMGKLKAKHCYWDRERKNIYTLNIVDITCYLKGNKGKSEVGIITMGGLVNDKEQITYPSLRIEYYNEYIFFLEKDNRVIDNDDYRSGNPELIQALPYASSQGAITKQFGFYYDLYGDHKVPEEKMFQQISKLTNEPA